MVFFSTSTGMEWRKENNEIGELAARRNGSTQADTSNASGKCKAADDHDADADADSAFWWVGVQSGPSAAGNRPLLAHVWSSSVVVEPSPPPSGVISFTPLLREKEKKDRKQLSVVALTTVASECIVLTPTHRFLCRDGCCCWIRGINQRKLALGWIALGWFVVVAGEAP